MRRCDADVIPIDVVVGAADSTSLSSQPVESVLSRLRRCLFKTHPTQFPIHSIGGLHPESVCECECERSRIDFQSFLLSPVKKVSVHIICELGED